MLTHFTLTWSIYRLDSNLQFVVFLLSFIGELVIRHFSFIFTSAWKTRVYIEFRHNEEQPNSVIKSANMYNLSWHISNLIVSCCGTNCTSIYRLIKQFSISLYRQHRLRSPIKYPFNVRWTHCTSTRTHTSTSTLAHTQNESAAKSK